MPTGYSGTPLSKKLGIKAGSTIILVEQPDYYFDLFEEYPEGIIQVDVAEPELVDFIHIFCKDQEALWQYFPNYLPALKRNGMIWISWPKKSSNVPTDINENIIRDYILAEGLVDIKVAAIDQIWSALKIVYRKKDR